MTDRREGPTPAGGDYSEAVYLDHEGREVEPERATQIVIRELDRAGRLVAETWGTIERGRPTPRRIVAQRGEGRYVLVETGEPEDPPAPEEPPEPVEVRTYGGERRLSRSGDARPVQQPRQTYEGEVSMVKAPEQLWRYIAW